MTLRFKGSQLGYFFSKEKLDSTRPPRRQPRNSLPNWIFITSGHFVVNYEGRCKKKKNSFTLFGVSLPAGLAAPAHIRV